MERLTPIPVDHEVREEFICDMVEELAVNLDEPFWQAAAEGFYDELWQISWELEAYYTQYVQGFNRAYGEPS